jgi:putative protease
MIKLELLSPAGSFPSLIAAVENGADSVYLGLKEFSMRAEAHNFSLSDLKKAREICNSQGLRGRKVKIYLTLNTIIYDNEIKKIENIIKKVKREKLADAIICWDLSVIKLCKKYKIPFHISTQASIANSESAKFYKKLGAERAVLARELNISQIKEISKTIKTEVFIHGAMCVSVSGRCFTSQFLFGKSANRGECLQPCRRAYKITDEDSNELILENNRVMSPKDLCTLPFIDQLKKAGIQAFKIEGRNRSPEYVSVVTRVYRKALDKNLTKEEIYESLEELKKVYHRGMSPGFYTRMPTADDFSSSETGEQKESKKLVGRIEKYWPKARAVSLKMFAGSLKIGDSIYIIGKQTGIKKMKVESLEFNNKPTREVKKAQEVGLKLNFEARKGDEVYLIVRKKS